MMKNDYSKAQTLLRRWIKGSALYPLDSEDQEVSLCFSSQALFRKA